MKDASPPLPFPRGRLVLAVVLTGVAAGLAAAALSWMIHFVEHLAFGQSEAQSRIVTEGTTPERRMGALLCAGLLVTLCWTWLQVKGRPVVGIKGAIAADTPARRRPPFFEGTVHALLQIVAVGSGAPIGRELAPRELGSLFSGRICDRLGIDGEMRRLLVASGSAAGLAGVYQVPFAGAIFALEILLGRFTVTYGIVALAVSVIATVVARVEVTTDAFYVLGQIDGSVVTVLWSAVIGMLVGLPAAAFRRAVLHAEQYRAKQWDVLWALPLALLLTEVVAIWLPQVLGNGRSVAQTAYDGITMGMCLALILGKSVVVLATLRGGAYGGTLQPAVALGALSGIMLGTGLHLLPVWAWLPPSAAGADLHAAAVAGSAAFLAVSMNAPLTAFGLVMGFTGQHDTAALPLLASVSAGMGMAHLWPQKKAAPVQEAASHGAAEQVAVQLPARAAVPLATVAGQGVGAGGVTNGRQTEVRVQRQTAEQTTIQWQDQEALGPAGIRIVREAIEQAAMQWREQETRVPVELTASPSPAGQLEIAWPGPERALPGSGRALYLERERARAEPQAEQADGPTEIRVSVVISVPPGERSLRTRR